MNTPLSYSVTRWKDGGWQHIDDAVSPEEPVYVSWSGNSCRLWAWPDDLEPLAIGHVLLDRRHLGPEAGPSPFRMSGSVRAVSVPPGIDAKHAFAVELKRMEKKGHDETPSIVMTPDAIVKHMDAFLTLEGSCPLLWESTGCFHRAGMFDPNTGTFLRLAEDIGRHNAMDKLVATGLVPVIRAEAEKKPLLGICLGMQLLFEKSYEYGEHAGLGFIQGEVCPLEPDLTDKSLKVPQIGWNALHIVKDDPLFQYIREGEYVYYVHSYYGKNCTESTLATSEYSIPVTGAVRAGKVYGTQFHPEKSGDVGLRILKAFCGLEGEA